MQFPNCSKSKTRTSSGIFLKKMPPLTLLAGASELEELH
jgi:hypothetical protein